MGSVYSERLAFEKALAGDSGPFTPPLGSVWVVRDVNVYNGNVLEEVGASITTNLGIVLWAETWNPAAQYPPDALQRFECRWVIPPGGGFLQFHATFPVDFYLSGYVLALP